MEDPCWGGFSDFDGIIMEIKKEIDDFFSDMNSIFPNFHKGRNSTDSSSSEEDWVDDFLKDIKKSFHNKNNKDDGNKEETDNGEADSGGEAEELAKVKKDKEMKEDAMKPEDKTEKIQQPTQIFGTWGILFQITFRF